MEDVWLNRPRMGHDMWRWTSKIVKKNILDFFTGLQFIMQLTKKKFTISHLIIGVYRHPITPTVELLLAPIENGQIYKYI